MRQMALMYHDVVARDHWDDSGFPGAAAARYKLEKDEFARHLDALAGSGAEFPAFTAADDAHPSRCLLTFDDGGASASHIAAALGARNMRGHFFITTSRIGTRGFVSTPELRALRASGHVVGSHSHTHPADISRLSAQQLRDEWRRSVESLGDVLGESIQCASIPGGFYSEAVVRAAAAAGIRTLFTSEPTTRVAMIDACRVLGRYTLWHGMHADRALALVRDENAARARQWLAWNLRKPLKRWAGPVYRWARARMIEKRAG